MLFQQICRYKATFNGQKHFGYKTHSRHVTKMTTTLKKQRLYDIPISCYSLVKGLLSSVSGVTFLKLFRHICPSLSNQTLLSNQVKIKQIEQIKQNQTNVDQDTCQIF